MLGSLEVRAASGEVLEIGGARLRALLGRQHAQAEADFQAGAGILAGAQGDLDAARDWHARAMAAARSSADAPVIAEALTGLADLALREADPERAAELLGASVAIRGTEDRSVIDEKRVADEVRSVLGEAGYGAAYRRGQCATLDTLAALVTPGA